MAHELTVMYIDHNAECIARFIGTEAFYSNYMSAHFDCKVTHTSRVKLLD